jgi:hypothetical protein
LAEESGPDAVADESEAQGIEAIGSLFASARVVHACVQQSASIAALSFALQTLEKDAAGDAATSLVQSCIAAMTQEITAALAKQDPTPPPPQAAHKQRKDADREKEAAAAAQAQQHEGLVKGFVRCVRLYIHRLSVHILPACEPLWVQLAEEYRHRLVPDPIATGVSVSAAVEGAAASAELLRTNRARTRHCRSSASAWTGLLREQERSSDFWNPAAALSSTVSPANLLYLLANPFPVLLTAVDAPTGMLLTGSSFDATLQSSFPGTVAIQTHGSSSPISESDWLLALTLLQKETLNAAVAIAFASAEDYFTVLKTATECARRVLLSSTDGHLSAGPLTEDAAIGPPMPIPGHTVSNNRTNIVEQRVTAARDLAQTAYHICESYFPQWYDALYVLKSTWAWAEAQAEEGEDARLLPSKSAAKAAWEEILSHRGQGYKRPPRDKENKRKKGPREESNAVRYVKDPSTYWTAFADAISCATSSKDLEYCRGLYRRCSQSLFSDFQPKKEFITALDDASTSWCKFESIHGSIPQQEEADEFRRRSIAIATSAAKEIAEEERLAQVVVSNGSTMNEVGLPEHSDGVPVCDADTKPEPTTAVNDSGLAGKKRKWTESETATEVPAPLAESKHTNARVLFSAASIFQQAVSGTFDRSAETLSSTATAEDETEKSSSIMPSHNEQLPKTEQTTSSTDTSTRKAKGDDDAHRKEKKGILIGKVALDKEPSMEAEVKAAVCAELSQAGNDPSVLATRKKARLAISDSAMSVATPAVAEPESSDSVVEGPAAAGVLGAGAASQALTFDPDVDHRAIFVRSLPFGSTNLIDIIDAFKQFGPIIDAKIITGKSGDCKGQAWLRFRTASSAAAACKQSKTLEIKGRAVFIDLARRDMQKKDATDATAPVAPVPLASAPVKTSAQESEVPSGVPAARPVFAFMPRALVRKSGK